MAQSRLSMVGYAVPYSTSAPLGLLIIRHLPEDYQTSNCCPQPPPKLFQCTESLLPHLSSFHLGCGFSALPVKDHTIPVCLCSLSTTRGQESAWAALLVPVTLGHRVSPCSPVTFPRMQSRPNENKSKGVNGG